MSIKLSKYVVSESDGLTHQNSVRETKTPITIYNAGTVNHFEHRTKKNKDLTPLRVRRTGKTQFWKTRPNEFKIPVKYGLYENGYITHENASDWFVASH